MLTSNGKLSTKATTKPRPAMTFPQYAGNIPANFEPPGLNQTGERETDFTVQRRRVRSSLELVTDNVFSATLGLRGDTINRGQLHAGHYLFNSMPCAYTWFHH
jgi:hypothetical protein